MVERVEANAGEPIIVAVGDGRLGLARRRRLAAVPPDRPGIGADPAALPATVHRAHAVDGAFPELR